MECTVCLNEWNSETHVPRMLNCGHSYCEQCLNLLFKKGNHTTITCPSCQQIHQFNSIDDLKNLIKNYTLLSLAATKQPVKIEKDNKSGILEDDQEEVKGEIKQIQSIDKKEYPKIKYNQRCKKHNLIIHSFEMQTRDLLCTKCIYEKNLQTNQIEILPQVIKDIKQSIESTRIMILYRRNQLYQSLKYMQRMQRGNREVIQNKLMEHFQKIRKLVDVFEQKAKNKFEELMEQQNAKLSLVQSQIEEFLDKLYNDDLNLSSLESHDDNEIIYMTNIIDDQKEHLINFKPNIEFEDVSIALQLRESAYEKIDQMLQTTCNLMLDNLRFEDETPIKFEHILEKDKYWLCINCNQKLNSEDIICDQCYVFRPLEMYKNILHNPMSITDEELDYLNQRRRIEKYMILEKDLEQNTDSYWYMISSDWLFQWKCFISNKLSFNTSQSILDQVRVSENQDIGILPPRQISNHCLFLKFNERESIIKEDLQLNIHYRGVNKNVWTIFHSIYGGGPVIIRTHLDIYSEDASHMVTQKNSAEAYMKSQMQAAQNLHKTQQPQKNLNIFAKKEQKQGSNTKKKRNLFQSENINQEEDEIPEELHEKGELLSQKQNLKQKFENLMILGNKAHSQVPQYFSKR